ASSCGMTSVIGAGAFEDFNDACVTTITSSAMKPTQRSKRSGGPGTSTAPNKPKTMRMLNTDAAVRMFRSQAAIIRFPILFLTGTVHVGCQCRDIEARWSRQDWL